MLDSSGYSAGDIYLGLDGFSGLTYLVGIGDPVSIHRGAAGPYRSIEKTGQFLENRVILGTFHPSSTRNNDIGFGNINRVLQFFH